MKVKYHYLLACHIHRRIFGGDKLDLVWWYEIFEVEIHKLALTLCHEGRHCLHPIKEEAAAKAKRVQSVVILATMENVCAICVKNP